MGDRVLRIGEDIEYTPKTWKNLSSYRSEELLWKYWLPKNRSPVLEKEQDLINISKVLQEAQMFVPELQTDKLIELLNYTKGLTSSINNDAEVLQALSLMGATIDRKDPEKIRNSIHIFLTSLVSALHKDGIDIPWWEKNIRKNILWETMLEEKWMSNIDGRIHSISSVIRPLSYTLIIDIIKAKRTETNFQYNLFYESRDSLLWFLNLLDKENLPEINKKLNFVKIDGVRWISEYWPWTRDGAITTINSNGKYTIIESKLSRATDKTNDNGWGDLIAYNTWNDIRQSELIFQWGNVRQTNGFMFIWVDDIIANLNNMQHSTSQLDSALVLNWKVEFSQEEIQRILHEFEKEFWKRIIPIGMNNENWHWSIPRSQPTSMYHIDLFLTPIWEKELIVAESDEKWLLDVIEELKKQWFIIHPLPSNISEATYNNAIIEQYNSEQGIIKKVYLPQYGLSTNKQSIKESDSQAKLFYEKLGFEVVPIRTDIKNVKLLQWSLNCLTSELRDRQL